MRHTITISMPKETKDELDRITAEEGISRSDVIRESLREYLFIRRFRALRARMISKAKSKGVFMDEEVFDRVS